MNPTLSTIQGEWVKIYAGYWSLLTVSYLGVQHTKAIRERFGIGPHKNIIVTRNGYSTSYYNKNDLAGFGTQLAELAMSDEKLFHRWCDEVKSRTDSLKLIMNQLKGKLPEYGITFDDYKSYLKEFYGYVPPYVAVKQVANFLSDDKTAKYLHLLDQTRLYTETLYTELEEFMCSLAKHVEKITGCPAELVLCCQKEEFEECLKSGALPQTSILKGRYTAGAQLFTDGQSILITGDEVTHVEQQLLGDTSLAFVKGAMAFSGKVSGRVRIIFDPFQAKDFKTGDILITGMTRPEFVPLMEKAAAIVTDAGGILCHAAIVAREMKKPCIIGAEKATKVFKDGDLVEVDATRGIVHKI